MTPKKQTGSYYTPEYLARFMFDKIALNFKKTKNLSILEPSVGDGAFVRAFNNATFSEGVESFTFTGLELIEEELVKADQSSKQNPQNNAGYSFKTVDFLTEQTQLKPGYQLIVGNPPYISKNLLTKEQVAFCEKIHDDAGLSRPSVKNIWAAFLIRCCSLLADDGILSFILPAELLQVKFSDEIRKYLNEVFQRVEIFTFNDLLFECRGQDIVLLTGFKKHEAPGHYYTHIVDTDDLVKGDYNLKKNEALANHNTKWSHHTLESAELEFIYEMASKVKTIDKFCESKPGIVTAANGFFIINKATEAEYGLKKFAKPIIQKGLFVNGSVVFSKNDFNILNEEGKPTKILAFNDNNAIQLSDKVREYLQIGKDLEIDTRYKCLKRTRWYHIPNISTVSEGFFFKRTHHYPKLLKNEAEVLVTDSAYKIQMRKGFAINNLVYSFYNSLTLLFAEIEGRYYGGGVLELTPSEFKKLPLPMVNISDDDFMEFVRFFEKKENINEVLTINDEKILGQYLGLSNSEVKKVNKIYKKLVQKRFRKNELIESIVFQDI